MDLATVIGLVVGMGGVIVGALMEGTHLTALIAPSAFFIVAVGSYGATMVGFPMETTKNAIGILKKAFQKPEISAGQMIQTMVGFATKARREGLLGLEEETEAIEDQFLKRGLQLVVDGTDIEMVRNILETDIAFLEARHREGQEYFGAFGGYCPTFGIIGTVLGLVHALGGASGEPTAMVNAIAVAFIATFYGILFANAIFLPLSFKLKANSAKEVLLREVMLEGILSISAGDNPRIVEEKLKAFLPPSEKLEIQTEGEEGEKK